MALSVDDLKSKLMHIQAGASTLGENLAKELRKAEVRQNVFRRGVRESRKFAPVLLDKSKRKSKQEEGTAAAIIDRSQRNLIKSPSKAGTKVSFQSPTSASPRTRQLTPRGRRHSPRTQQRAAQSPRQVKRILRKTTQKDASYATARSRQPPIDDETSTPSDASVDGPPSSPLVILGDNVVEQQEYLEDAQDTRERVAMVSGVTASMPVDQILTEVFSDHAVSRPLSHVSAIASSAHNVGGPSSIPTLPGVSGFPSVSEVPRAPNDTPSNAHDSQNAPLLPSTRHEAPLPTRYDASIRVSPFSYPAAPSTPQPVRQPQSVSSTGAVLNCTGSHLTASPHGQPSCHSPLVVPDPQMAPNYHAVGNASPSIYAPPNYHGSLTLPNAPMTRNYHAVASASPDVPGTPNAVLAPQQWLHHGSNYQGFHETLSAAPGPQMSRAQICYQPGQPTTRSATPLTLPFAGSSTNEVPNYPEYALAAHTYQSSQAVLSDYGAPPHSQSVPSVSVAPNYQSSQAAPSDDGKPSQGVRDAHALAPSEAASAKKKLLGSLVADIRGLLRNRRAKSAEIGPPGSRSSRSNDLQSVVPTSLHELLHQKKVGIGTSHAPFDEKPRQIREHRSPPQEGLWSNELGTYELRARLDHAKRELRRSTTSATPSFASVERKGPELAGTYSSLPPVSPHVATPAAFNSPVSTLTHHHYLLPPSTHADASRRHFEPTPRHHHRLISPSAHTDLIRSHVEAVETLASTTTDAHRVDHIHHPDAFNELYLRRSSDHSARSARSDYGRSVRSEARGDGGEMGLRVSVKDEQERMHHPPTPKMTEALQMLKNEMEALRLQLTTQSHTMREQMVNPHVPICPPPKKASSPERNSFPDGPILTDMHADECDDSNEVVDIREKLSALRDEMNHTMNRIADSELGSIKEELHKLCGEVSHTSHFVNSHRLSNISRNAATSNHSGSILPHRPPSPSSASASPLAVPSVDVAVLSSSSVLPSAAQTAQSDALSYPYRYSTDNHSASTQLDSHAAHQRQQPEFYDYHRPVYINARLTALSGVRAQNTTSWPSEHRLSSAPSYATPPHQWQQRDGERASTSSAAPPPLEQFRDRPSERSQQQQSQQPPWPSPWSGGQQQRQLDASEYRALHSTAAYPELPLATLSPPASTRPHFVRDSVNYYPYSERAVGAEGHRVWGSLLSTASPADGVSSIDNSCATDNKRVSLLNLGVNGAGVRGAILKDGHVSPPVQRARSPTAAAVAATQAVDVLMPPCLKC
eukprot:GEMP01003394.1.p1 GENE.GEMP01003394.1~~GEMP01003394.1.p1  ORF type:complete len:1262 (+),score=282.58 GEMP01003394.1:32-3817(+)